MKQRFRGRLVWIWIASLLILALIAAGCGQVPRATPTVAGQAGAETPITEPPATEPPATEPTATPPPTSTPGASLETIEITVQRIRENNTVDVLKEEPPVDIQVDDQISVKEEGQGLLKFPDNLVVEILHGTGLTLQDATLERGKTIFAQLQQTSGTIRAKLNERRDARIKVETQFATITSVDAVDAVNSAVESVADFVVCHAPDKVTCLVTVAGEVEVEALGQVISVPAGEATYIFPGRPPGRPICADMVQVETWLDKYRNGKEVPGLGKIVAEWPQLPCKHPRPSPENMAHVDAGLYEVGIPEADEFHNLTREITTDGFWIDQYEVTNAQYQAFIGATGHPAPEHWPAGTPPIGQEKHPVKGVTWRAASDYCYWVYKRLPSESEWEIAARGPGSEPPLYPWGPDPSADGKAGGLPLSDTYEVGATDFNLSHFGVHDLAGNVWEWVGEPYDPVEGGGNILRGGRHGFLKDMAFRQPAEPNVESFIPFAGFRCAADHVDGE
jgi:formylglycine-generating enzyme required for sulfatase activity